MRRKKKDIAPFTHLHVHNEHSVLDGIGTADDYAKEARELGHSHLALTNHGNVDGIIKFQKACNKQGIIPIIGCEAYIVENHLVKEKGEKRGHITLLCSSEEGWQNLLKILTVANLDGFYRRPRIDPGILMRHIHGLVVLSACPSTFIHEKWGLKLLREIKEEVPVFLEVMPSIFDMQISTNRKKLMLSKKMGIPIVATCDCHYPTRDGALVQEVLLAMQRKAKWDDPDRWRFDITDLYLKSERQMVRSFQKQGVLNDEQIAEAIANTKKVVEACNGFYVEKKEVILPKVPGYEDADETKLLQTLVKKGYRRRLVKPGIIGLKDKSIYLDRIEEELGLICELGFQRYFLIVWELIDWCKNNDVMTGPGRGSVGGSLVAFCLGITDIDPIKHGLIFSRFISPARIDLPDIDMDFEDIKRDQIRKHLQDNYGINNVAGLSTFTEMKGRSALRDVSRVFDLPEKDVDPAAKSIVVRSGGDFRSNFSIEDAFETFEDGIRFKKKYPEVTRIAMDLEGQIKSLGQHAAAMCISLDDLRKGERCNLRILNNTVVANWDKHDAEYMGLMKLDVLGLTALTILNETRRMIRRNHGVEIEFDKIPMDDKKVFKEISSGHTIGAFQIGSLGLSGFCKQLGVDTFDDIVFATSLWRPGTLRSGMAHEFVARKHNKTEWEHIHPALEELTDDTYGIILFQEQVMRFMYDLGGLPWKTCDTIRKVISKSQGDALFQKFKKTFADGCESRGTLGRDEAERVWDELSSFGSYGFNKSHAAEYSLITYWDMWLKVHYTTEFIANSLTYTKKEENLDALVSEARRLGLKILLPKIGVSSPTKWETKPGEPSLYMPFQEIKGIGEKTAIQVANLKLGGDEGFFKNDDEVRMPNKAVMESLQRIHAFDPIYVLSSDEELGVEDLFSFDISSDPMRKVRGIYELLKPKLTLIDDVDFSRPDRKDKLFFGSMVEIRFSYKQNVLKDEKKKKEQSYGGVYGFFRDESANTMLVFNSDLYEDRKDDVEHCQGQWMLAAAAHPRKQTSLNCRKAALESDLLRADFQGIEVDLIREPKIIKANGKLDRCKACSLSREATCPVTPSIGEYNLMLIGEAPGKDEDLSGQGFTGRTGYEILWPTMAKHNLTRKMFHVTNVVKCWPSKTKTPTLKHIQACRVHLEREFRLVKPISVLAFGNTAIKFFTGEKKGIMERSGTTEWNKDFNCWITWCMHPSSVLYHRQNRKKFREGINEFSRVLSNIGF